MQSSKNSFDLGKRSAPQNDPWADSDNRDTRPDEKKPTNKDKKQKKRDGKDCSQQLAKLGGSKSKCEDEPEDGEFENFEELTDGTIKRLEANKITSLFPIQQKCFHPIFAGSDVIGRDLTGCGKTLAFSLPVLERLRKDKTLGTRKIQAIVLAPTRELARQCEATVSMLKHHPGEFQSMTVYGQQPYEIQEQRLDQGVDIVVGTTGRIKDHINRGNIDFADMRTVILDEADKMLEMGFKEDIEQILAKIREACGERPIQICLFSATVPQFVVDVAREYMREDFKVVDLAQNLQNKTAKNVKHLAIDVQGNDRVSALANVLKCLNSKSKAIVFTETKKEANELAQSDKLKSIEAMHGDIKQFQRERTLDKFKENNLQVLVATNVAARGLDIPNVDLVVMVQPPQNTEDYIHRSGRTARAGASGTCITFYDDGNENKLCEIVMQSGIELERTDTATTQEMLRNSKK